ncbi:TetR/AcrR family transcriptional regulator [Pelagicoccus sp. SDUM812003]|uniref:TetR/AcrR family transcriptional regulator n=1 Tax=Pelagicoccus sp. SDUM812003 TaxID=3041267 RepID=UPI0028103E05|nr:TetR/AcrR family transcriptional regulator [Pelagicoccus sp. SDUM812003]MDQ8202945.1 TetR/AcrR family transcriptional regulator [Pelagicoccus sp. SDUM812003]
MSEIQSPAPRSSPKRDLLLATAFRLFNERGYHAVGIDTILAEAGVAKMTLYNHFKSKDELIAAALDRRAKDILVHRENALSQAGRDPFDKIAALFDGYGSWFRSADFKGCAFIRAVGEFPDADHPINQLVQEQKQALIDLIESFCEEAGADDPTSLAQQIYLLAEGAIVRAHTFSSPQAADLAKHAALTLLKAAIQRSHQDLPTHLL